jgi:hypothetical protein
MTQPTFKLIERSVSGLVFLLAVVATILFASAATIRWAVA